VSRVIRAAVGITHVRIAHMGIAAVAVVATEHGGTEYDPAGKKAHDIGREHERDRSESNHEPPSQSSPDDS
jgi:hypothetical protein